MIEKTRKDLLLVVYEIDVNTSALYVAFFAESNSTTRISNRNIFLETKSSCRQPHRRSKFKCLLCFAEQRSPPAHAVKKGRSILWIFLSLGPFNI